MLNIPLHRSKLYEILELLSSSPYGRYIGFKGGTLAYFLYSLDRFSTDLDFDLIQPIQDEEAIIAHISDILSHVGTIKDAYNKTWTLFRLLDYGSDEMNIKIEINKRTWKSDNFQLQKILGTELFCMDPASMFANKLVALIDRKRTVSRDLYDINFFFRKGFPINEALILERTGKDTKVYLLELKEYITKQFHTKNLLAGLGELLNSKQNVRVKDKLIENTLGFIDLALR